MGRVPNKIKRLRAARAAMIAKVNERKSAEKAQEESTTSLLNRPIKQEATTSSSTCQIPSKPDAAALKVLETVIKIKEEVIDPELSPPPKAVSSTGQSLTQKKIEKSNKRKAAVKEMMKNLQEARARKALNRSNLPNNENRVEAVNSNIPSTSNASTMIEETNYFRHVPVTEYFPGYNSSGLQDALLIVLQPNDKTLAREYYRSNPCWQCIACKILGKKVNIRINDKEVFAPLKHYCYPKNVEDIMKEQAEYQNLSLFGDVGNLERDAEFYSSSNEFDKFDSTEYKFGMSSYKRPNSRLIVSKKRNPKLVYYYHKQGRKWICCGCFKIYGSKAAFGEFINKDLYLPKKHVCKPLKAEESEAEQQHLISNSVSVLKVEKLFEEERNNLRRLFLNDIEYGIAKNGKELLIVCEPDVRSLVYEFAVKSPSVWFCLRCSAKKKTDTYVIKKDGLLYTSKTHKCEPLEYNYSMCKQTALLNPGLKRKRIQYLAAQKGYTMPFPKGSRLARLFAPVKKASPPTTSKKPPAKHSTPKLLAQNPQPSKESGGSDTVSAPKKKSFPLKTSRPSKSKINHRIRFLRPVHAGSSNQTYVYPTLVNPSLPPVISLAPFDFGGRTESASYSNLPSSSFTNDNNSVSNITSSFINPKSNNNLKTENQTKFENSPLSEMAQIPIKSVESVSSALLRFVESLKSSRNQSSTTSNES